MSVRGAMLEVLDRFRSNEAAETALNRVEGLIGVDILEEESAAVVPGNWLSKQRLARALLSPTARFVDVTEADVLAELNGRERIQKALHLELALGDELAEQDLGPDARLDDATIRMTGPLGRVITQAVSREIHDDDAMFAGLSYVTRFDRNERCWAVFDDRVQVTFDEDEILDDHNIDHVQALDGVARTYRLDLPSDWRLSGG